jgi:hypothetical protein
MGPINREKFLEILKIGVGIRSDEVEFLEMGGSAGELQEAWTLAASPALHVQRRLIILRRAQSIHYREDSAGNPGVPCHSALNIECAVMMTILDVVGPLRVPSYKGTP